MEESCLDPERSHSRTKGGRPQPGNGIEAPLSAMDESDSIPEFQVKIASARFRLQTGEDRVVTGG